jgi:hypothetical protein
MKKSVLALTTATILAGSAATYAVAQQQPPAPAGKTAAEDSWRPSPADRAAFVAARVAALHARLALTPEQEKLWPPVESVLKDIAQKREARWEQRRAERRTMRESMRENKDAPRPDAMARLRRGAEFMTETGNDLKRLADAAQPLYATLDDAQKSRLEWLVRRSMHGGMHDHMGPHMRERAMGRFSEWRGRHHWRDRDGNAGPHREWRDRRGFQNNGDDDPDGDYDYEGERL